MFRSVTFSSHAFDDYINIEENPKSDFNEFGKGAVISGDGLQAACISNNAVTLFNAATGQEITRLEAASNGFEFGFGEGMSMDFSGNILAVNNNGFSSNSGQVKLFNPKTGAFIDTLSNPRSGFNDGFGRKTSLSADGSRIAIGSPFYNVTVHPGACHVFSLPSKTLLATILNPTSNTDFFGGSISLSGDGSTLAVGSRDASAGGNYRGRAAIFNASSGALLRNFTSPNPEDQNKFGYSISMNFDGTLVAIGETRGDSPTPNAGTVYLFKVSDGSLLRTFPSPDSFVNVFGRAVALSSDGSTLIVSSEYNTIGRVYVFKTTDSTVVKSIPLPGIPTNPNPNWGDFGESLSITHDGSRFVTGAPEMGTNDFSSGDDYSGRFYIYNSAD